MDFLNMQLPEDENEKFSKLDSWTDFMNSQMKKIKETQEKVKINDVLLDNGIDIIE